MVKHKNKSIFSTHPVSLTSRRSMPVLSQYFFVHMSTAFNIEAKKVGGSKARQVIGIKIRIQYKQNTFFIILIFALPGLRITVNVHCFYFVPKA